MGIIPFEMPKCTKCTMPRHHPRRNLRCHHHPNIPLDVMTCASIMARCHRSVRHPLLEQCQAPTVATTYEMQTCHSTSHLINLHLYAFMQMNVMCVGIDSSEPTHL